MKAEASSTKMVKMKAQVEIRIYRDEEYAGKTFSAEKIIKPGQIFDATEEEATDYEKVLVGGHSFSGERHAADGEVTRTKMKRAVRVQG